MRIWSIHPQYLDPKGLVALWREAVLAKHVLEGETKGYKNHPQLIRFKEHCFPTDCINYYLSVVYEEAVTRGYNFDRNKIRWDFSPVELTVTKEQVNFEELHLKNKLRLRNLSWYNKLIANTEIIAHPLFRIIDGKIEEWEHPNGLIL
jgi:hypothetical protein